MSNNNLNHDTDGLLVLADFFYIKTATIRKNTAIVQETFEDLYKYISTN